MFLHACRYILVHLHQINFGAQRIYIFNMCQRARAWGKLCFKCELLSCIAMKNIKHCAWHSHEASVNRFRSNQRLKCCSTIRRHSTNKGKKTWKPPTLCLVVCLCSKFHLPLYRASGRARARALTLISLSLGVLLCFVASQDLSLDTINIIDTLRFISIILHCIITFYSHVRYEEIKWFVR